MASKKGIASGVRAIITGASTGIGRALAERLGSKHNACLVLNARDGEVLARAGHIAEKAGAQVILVKGDVSDAAVQEKLVKSCMDSFGGIDMLVNNAGFARPGAITAITPEDWRRVFDVNFFAPVELTYRVLPHFIERKQGKIVNVASVAGKVALPGSVCYAASKFALVGMSEGMAAELSRQGIDTITVCPGLVRTEFFAKNHNPEDVTAMANEKNLTGWILRNFISISSEEAADSILHACARGGSSEIVLTGPGKVLERVAGLCPPVAFKLASAMPASRTRRRKENAVP